MTVSGSTTSTFGVVDPPSTDPLIETLEVIVPSELLFTRTDIREVPHDVAVSIIATATTTILVKHDLTMMKLFKFERNIGKLIMKSNN